MFKDWIKLLGACWGKKSDEIETRKEKYLKFFNSRKEVTKKQPPENQNFIDLPFSDL